MRIPVLAYHAMNIAGAHSMNNDHVALRGDLRELHDAGYAFVAAHEAVSAAIGLTPPRNAVRFA